MLVRFLVILGVVLLLTGLFWPFLAKLGFGRLPGDVVVERKNFKLYLPLMTSILISRADLRAQHRAVVRQPALNEKTPGANAGRFVITAGAIRRT